MREQILTVLAGEKTATWKSLLIGTPERAPRCSVSRPRTSSWRGETGAVAGVEKHKFEKWFKLVRRAA